MTPSPLDASAAIRPLPAKRTYGKKRYLTDSEDLGAERIELPTKKSRVTASPTKSDNRPNPNAQTPLQRVPVNAPPHRLDPPPSSRLASPTKLARRGTQDQNALDSPFLEPRKPSRSPGLGRGYALRRVSSSTKFNPHTRSRHLSINRSGSNTKARVAKETPSETLRRKTSEATTTLSTTLTKHSWLVPPPPRSLVPKRGLPAHPGPSMFDFSFNPPAESTLAHVSRPARTPPIGTVGDPLIILGSDETPIARRPSLQDEIAAALPRNTERHRKRHDSILSTDSEDFGTTISIFGLTPKPRPVNVPSPDPDATPRNPPSLIEQLCGSRSRSGSVTVRSLSHDIPSSIPFSHPSSDADDEMAEGPPRRQDSIRALTEACAEMDLGGDSSPSRLIKAASKQAKGKRKIEESKHKLTPPLASPVARRVRHSGKPYQLSPHAVHRLSQQRRVGMRIGDRPLSPDDDVDMFASYEFDRGVVKDTGN